MPAVDEVARPDFAYLRLHGRNKHWLKARSAADRHLHDYNARELREIAARVRRLAREAGHVHVVANNHSRPRRAGGAASLALNVHSRARWCENFQLPCAPSPLRRCNAHTVCSGRSYDPDGRQQQHKRLHVGQEPYSGGMPGEEPRPRAADSGRVTMDSPDDISAIIFASLADLSLPSEGEAMRASIARGIKHMSIYRILELRQRIHAQLDEELPVVRETLELLDGQIILREIAGRAHWR